MSFLESIFLGIIQALTEFFPVSSSAHLKLLKHFLGLQDLDQYVLLDLSCHLGTLCALCLFLRKDIAEIFLRERKKMLLYFLALIPLIPAYFLLKPVREFASHPSYLGLCLIGSGLILLAGQNLRIPQKTGKMKDALLIGTMQSVALIPGISRSASTISCARVLGWDIKDAVRFSFLLSIPTIIGGELLELYKALTHFPKGIGFPITTIAASFCTSFFIGIMVVGKAIRYLEKGNLRPFAWYCLALGIFAALYFNL